MEFKHIVVFITVPSEEVGRQIADMLVEKKLAACVSAISPVKSLYTWKGETVEDEEVLLVVKARADGLEERLIPAVRAMHPYEVPEIIALPIVMGLGSYLEWIDTVTDEEGE
jgi:periplasmic divalent cation tolerance protein